MENISNITMIDMEKIYQSGYIYSISQKILDLLEYYTIKHSKILVVRFDIRYPVSYDGAGSNRDISACLAYVVKKYKRWGLDPCYIWVREQHRSVHPHFHCALLLDGQKVRTYTHVFRNVEEAWGRTLGCSVSGCINHCTSGDLSDYNGKMLRRDVGHKAYMNRLHEVLRQLSYLAKAYTKELGYDGQRNFGCTQLPHERVPSYSEVFLSYYRWKISHRCSRA